jgi:hypothetical protein
MQVVIITQGNEYIDVFKYQEDKFDLHLLGWADMYITLNEDKFIDIDYWEGGEVSVNKDYQTIMISGDNGIITYNYIIKPI